MIKFAQSLRALLLLYFLLCLVIFGAWKILGANATTGDEPHYLVTASGMVKHFTVEQTLPYEDEFRDRAIYPGGLAPPGSVPSPSNTHAAEGPHGLFTEHGLGLPLLMSVPLLIGGVTGARLMMIALGSLLIVVAFQLASYFGASGFKRVAVTGAATLGLPLLLASNQIYPDLPAGIIGLFGLYYVLTQEKEQKFWLRCVFVAALCLLPWLHIKYSAEAAVLTLYYLVESMQRGRLRSSILTVVPVAASVLLLLAYNEYAFARLTGPYAAGAVEVSRMAALVFVGLFLDQNHGMLLQNPINLIGLAAIGRLFAYDRRLTIAWVLVLLSVVVPNSMHPAWYGGFSVSGRVGWTGEALFALPAIYGTLQLIDQYPRQMKLALSVLAAFQVYCFVLYGLLGESTYNRGVFAWPYGYSLFYYPFGVAFPLLYNANWAVTYLPNYVWVALALMLIAVGFQGPKWGRRLGWGISAGAVLVVLSGFFGVAAIGGDAPIYPAAVLPSQSGRLVDGVWVAEAGTDAPGYVTFGPYVALRWGAYDVSFEYSSAAAADTTVGTFDIYDTSTGGVIEHLPIAGTANAKTTVHASFHLSNLAANMFEFRTYWNGKSSIGLDAIGLALQ